MKDEDYRPESAVLYSPDVVKLAVKQITATLLEIRMAT